MKRLWKKLTWTVLGGAFVALLGYAFVPKPVEVDLAEVERGAMRVTVDQDGKTRVRERYVVAAPLGGRLARIPFKAGDPVEARKTVLAIVEPTPPQLLDARAREEAEARVRWSEAALRQAEPDIARAEARLEQARLALSRRREVATSQAISLEELDQKTLAVSEREAEVRMAVSARDVARFQLEQAKAVLVRATETVSPGESTAFEVFSPIDGQVLRVIRESESPVTPGTALLEVGDVRDIEAVIDVLSRDAVKVKPGAAVLLERWGGNPDAENGVLRGRVRRVEPSGFTKISALGVEEQRVNVIVDFVDPIEKRPALGDGYRVDARIVVWEQPEVTRIPSGALFRTGDNWSTYVATREGRARLQHLRLGRMNGMEAEVLDGVQPGDRVILHPSDKIKHDVAVTERK
jgi:HlyD family secretion protein